MRRGFIAFAGLVVLLLVLLPASLGAGGDNPGRGPTPHVSFTQLNWLADDGTPLVPFSRVGVAELTFSAADEQLLERNGGGYVNLVTDTGSGTQWSVENLYLSYPDVEYMAASHPTVQFALGVGNGTRADAVLWSGSVTAGPLAEPPLHAGDLAPVAHDDYLVGGLDGGGSGHADIVNTIGTYVGCNAADCIRPSLVALTPLPSPITFEDIAEDPMGCAPAAVARSLKYLLGDAELRGVSAQDIYRELYQAMGTTAAAGTKTEAIKPGKQKYVKAHKLPVHTNEYNFKNGTRFGSEALPKGGDVELVIEFGDDKGHVATVTSITSLGKGKGHQIKYVDDPVQGDGKPESKEHTIETDKDGNVTAGGKGKVTKFLVEEKKKK